MQRQRDELVPVGEVIADLPGPVQAIREASPQALHHFTRFDQVNQLVSASEADADLGFMARLMALCSLASAFLLCLSIDIFVFLCTATELLRVPAKRLARQVAKADADVRVRLGPGSGNNATKIIIQIVEV